MEQLCRLLKPLTNLYTILIIWVLTSLNFYLCFKPLLDYATAASLQTLPVVLDALTYYTADEGYEVLSILGDQGRQAYRLVNYADFVLPILLFLSLSLPHVAMGTNNRWIVFPLAYMLSDYMENIAEKYVLEIYPSRNDFVMTLASSIGFIKLVTFAGSILVLTINGLIWIWPSKSSNKRKTK